MKEVETFNKSQLQDKKCNQVRKSNLIENYKITENLVGKMN